MPDKIRAGLVQYETGKAATFDAFVGRVSGFVKRAADEGAALVVFPEYLCVDLLPAAIGERKISRADLPAMYAEIDEFYAPFADAMAALAKARNVWLVAGTFAHRFPDGAFRNAAQIFGPSGERLEQPKLHVAYELVDNRGMIAPGNRLQIFDLLGARTAVLVCYDAQFPETGRAAIADGDVDLFIVPGCAMEEWGIWRLRTASAARAMESIAFALNVQLAGSIEIPNLVSYRFWARSSAHTPVSRPFAPNGLLVESTRDGDDLLLADLDVGLLRESRPQCYPSLKDRTIPIATDSTSI